MLSTMVTHTKLDPKTGVVCFHSTLVRGLYIAGLLCIVRRRSFKTKDGGGLHAEVTSLIEYIVILNPLVASDIKFHTPL